MWEPRGASALGGTHRVTLDVSHDRRFSHRATRYAEPSTRYDLMDLPYDAVAASHALAASDPGMAELIAAVGPPRMTLRPDETLAALARSIAYQQLSTKAAATIHGRFLDAFADASGAPDADRVLASSDEALRACGLSRAKVAALRDLAARHATGRLPARADLLGMSDEEAIAALVAVRGVGVWTAQMVLMSNLGRPDVWPVADLGVQEGVRLIQRLDDRPTARAMGPLGEGYRPWRSIAAWYAWRAVHRARGEE